MASGRKNKLTGQIGEFLVTAELGRRNYVAAPFAGNVPLFDIVAANECGKAIPIQVKTSNGISWHSQADKFLDIKIANGIQHIKGKKKLRTPDLLCVYVLLNKDRKDSFYILQLKDLQNIIFKDYSAYLKRKKGRRPKNPNSIHCAINPEHLISFRENWKLLQKLLS